MKPKFKSLILPLSLILAFVFSPYVSAQGLDTPGGYIAYPVQTINRASQFLFTEDLGTLVAKALPFVFIFSGLAMLVYLVLGGFQLMTSAGDPKAIKEAQGKITNALIGFFVIFAAYWLIQILQVVLHLSILSP